MPKIREDEEIALPISEEFARFLFGPDAGPIQGNDPRSAGAAEGDVRSHMPLSQESLPILNAIGRAAAEDYIRAHPIATIVRAPAQFRISRLGIQYVGWPHKGNQIAIAFIYGQWNEIGPRMILRWLVDNPRTGAIEMIRKYMNKLHHYDAHMSGERNINTRMRTAKKSVEGFNTAKEELESKGIPENVMEHIIGSMIRTKTNKAAPLSRLIKNKRGGSRHRAPPKGGARLGSRERDPRRVTRRGRPEKY